MPILESGLEGSQLVETNKLMISDNNTYLDIKTYKDTETSNYFIIAAYDNKISIELSMSSFKDEYENNKKLFNQILSTLKFIKKGGIQDWNIYNNPEADFTFQYPKEWKITADYFYKTAVGSKADVPTIILQKIGNNNTNDEIAINARQYSCEGKIGKCVDLYSKGIQVYIGTHSIDSEILATFDEIIGSFEKKDEAVN